MADRVTTGDYEFDPNGTNPDNLITNELQTLQTPGLDDFYFIIPFAAPFFVDSLQLFNHQNNQPYVEGQDYLVGHKFIEAMDSTGREIAGSIRFLRHDIGGVVRLRYRTLGGQWGFNDAAILQELANRQLNPLIRTWGQIDVLPATFPPLPHDQQIDDLVGSDDLLEAMEGIKEAIEAAGEGSTSQHINDHNNPHQVNKNQVGLGSVENLPLANKQQAEDGESNTSYMTPLRTSEAIAVQALGPLNDHVDDTENPHEVTKDQVGLGLVENFPIASDTEAVNPALNNRYITPYSAALILQNTGAGQQIQALEQQLNQHVDDKDNPHEVTAAQLDVYTKGEVDQLMDGFQAEDTERFAGMTDEEWRTTLPTFTDVEDVITTLQDGYTAAVAEIGSIDVSITPLDPIPEAVALVAGDQRYVIILDNGRAVEIPRDDVLGDDLSGDIFKFYFGEDAAYYITPEGTVRASGTAAIQPPAEYVEGVATPPTDPATGIVTGADQIYLVLESGDVLHYNTSTSSVVASAASEVAVGLNGPTRLIIVHDDGTVTAQGDHDFATAMGAVLSPLTDAKHAVVLDGHVYLRFEDYTLRCWSTELNGSNYEINTVVLPIGIANDVQRISGCADHIVIVKLDGSLHFEGSNASHQQNVHNPAGPYVDAAAGVGFTVTIDEQGAVQFWGDAPDNRYLPPVTFKGVN